MHKTKQHDTAIDYLRMISILAVVMIHTTTKTIQLSNNNLDSVPISLFLNQASRFAVPLFFMISGFVLEMNYPYHTGYFGYLKKRLSKIFIPYVLWSAIYFFFVFHKKSILSFITTALPTGGSSYQLYFIPSLLIFYLLFPYIHFKYKSLSQAPSIIIMAIVQFIFLILDYYLHAFPLFHPFNIVFFNFFVFFLGIFASHHKDKVLFIIKKYKIFLFLSAILLTVLLYLEGKIFYLATQDYRMFYSQWRPSVVIYTIIVASLLYYLFTISTKFNLFAKQLSKYSFLVFFIHVMVIEYTWNYWAEKILGQTQNYFQQLWFDPLYFLMVVSISFIIAFVIRKIPKVSFILG